MRTPRFIVRLGKGIAFLVLAGIILGAALFIFVAQDLPRPERFAERELSQTTKIYDRTGDTLLYTVHGDEQRTPVPLDKIPESMQQAVIATEDAEFYKHKGLDVEGVARAAWLNMQRGNLQHGGSTISQQLVRSTFLTAEKTIWRKIRELLLTLEMERRYDKQRILGWYLNQVPFGSDVYGVEAAAERYFDKNAEDLTVRESASLAAMIKAPTYYSPYGPNKDALEGRTNYVLRRMREEGFLTAEQEKEKISETLEFVTPRTGIKAPHFTLHVVSQLEQRYGEDFLRSKGLKIRTTLDWELQQKAQDVVSRWADRNTVFNAHNAALVATVPQTGEVRAMVGSKDWSGTSTPTDCTPGDDCLFAPKFNAATAKNGRQPGSAFKPFVYATAFEKGYSDTTTVVDERTNFGIWGGEPYIPENYTGTYHGTVTLRQALAQSINIPAVKVLNNMAGIEDSIQTAKEMGITTLNKPPSFYGLSLVLGGGEVRLIDMVSAYGVFANEGERVPFGTIAEIKGAQGETIFKREPPVPKRVLSTRTARMINSILSDNEARTPTFRPDNDLHIEQFEAAAKTGTTNDYKDAWTVGYTDELSAGVWVGNNDNSPMTNGPGVTVAAPIWNDFMKKAAGQYPPGDLPD